jgi:hypothetical protein
MFIGLLLRQGVNVGWRKVNDKEETHAGMQVRWLTITGAGLI